VRVTQEDMNGKNEFSEVAIESCAADEMNHLMSATKNGSLSHQIFNAPFPLSSPETLECLTML
jgi:hypothetical protein